MSVIGQGIDRLDGRLKVTGQARYAAEYPIPGVAYGGLVLSTVPKGRIVAIDSESVRRMQVRYAAEPAQLDFDQAKQHVRRPEPQPGRPADSGRGNVARSMQNAATRLDVTYTTPMENHNPLEPHATTAV